MGTILNVGHTFENASWRGTI